MTESVIKNKVTELLEQNRDLIRLGRRAEAAEKLHTALFVQTMALLEQAGRTVAALLLLEEVRK